MARYAQDTEVSSEKSRMEIERTLTRYGADQFMYGWKDTAAVIAFRARGRNIRFSLPMPSKDDKRFIRDGRNHVRTGERRLAAWEQDTRQRWRALALCIKAKLEAVEAGITHFDDEFMAQIVLPNGQTMSEHAQPLIARAYETGEMPPLLPHIQ
jgi:hypothetical protein